MARPTKERKDRRYIRITVRLTEAESAQLEKLSAYAGLQASEVIREAVLKNRVLQAKVPVLDQQTYVKLKRIGNNINQIAKHFNAGKGVGAKVYLETIEKQLSIILKKLIQ